MPPAWKILTSLETPLIGKDSLCEDPYILKGEDFRKA